MGDAGVVGDVVVFVAPNDLAAGEPVAVSVTK
jgi:hypothetical protein